MPTRYLAGGGDLPLSNEVQLDLLRTMMQRELSLRIRVRGSSMTPLIRGGDVVTVSPMGDRPPQVGEVVACVLPGSGRLALHRVVGQGEQGWSVRGDSCRESDGVVATDSILGRVVRVERNRREVSFGTGKAARGIALLSRAGGLWLLLGPRRLGYRAVSVVRQGVQRVPTYRRLGARFGRLVSIEEAGPADVSRALGAIGHAGGGRPARVASTGHATSWVAKRRGRVVGFVHVDATGDQSSGRSAYTLCNLWVKGRYRGLGIGEALATRALAYAAAQGATSMRLAVDDDSAIARNLFHKLGFAGLAEPESDLRWEQGEQAGEPKRIVLELGLDSKER